MRVTEAENGRYSICEIIFDLDFECLLKKNCLLYVDKFTYRWNILIQVNHCM